VLEWTNKRQTHRETLNEDKLMKIIHLINVEDKLSYEIINEDLREE
jgi:hypothetical protein